MSTFYGYYVSFAARHGRGLPNALDVIRQYWGRCRHGCHHFWEDFDIEWMENAARIDELVPEGKIDIHGDYGNYCYIGLRHSLSHGWASGPTAWLSEYVLGVRVEDGGKKVSINPHLCDLEWVEGSFPLKDGVLKIRHEKQADGSLKTEVSAPGKVKIVSDTKNMKMKVKRSR